MTERQPSSRHTSGSPAPRQGRNGMVADTMDALWSLRFHRFINEIGKYGRLIVNDHFSLILMVLFAYGIMYYRELARMVETGSKTSVALPIMALSFLILWGLLQLGRPLWFTGEADKAYLFPRGSEWRRFWGRGLSLAAILPVVGLFLSLLLLYPFLTQVTAWTSAQFWILTLLLFLVKGAVLGQKYLNALQNRKLDGPFAWIPSTFILLSAIVMPPPWHWGLPASLVVVWGIWLVWQYQASRHQRIDLEYVVDEENRRMANFYKWISAFADVPGLVPAVKRRSWLDGIIRWLSSLGQDRYSYLYLRSLFRHTAYSGIWLRVTLFVVVLLLIISNLWLGLALGLLGHIMTLVQLLPLLHHFDGHPLQRLYAHSADRVIAFRRTVRWILYAQSLFYALVFRSWEGALVWLALAEILLQIYLPWWHRKHG